VPYFAFGEELAASTDKGYEMTAALEVLAEMLSDRAPLPRKRRPSQPHVAAKPLAPRREPSFSGRRFAPEGQELQLSPSPVVDNKTAGAGTGGDLLVDHGDREHGSFGRRRWRWVGGIMFVVGATVLGVGKMINWDVDSLMQNGPGVEYPPRPSETESGETGEPTVDDALELGLLRAEVSFEFLAVYPRDQPAPRVFDGSLQCQFVLGSTPNASGWARTWRLQDIEEELHARVIEDLPLVDNVQRVAYLGFELRAKTPHDVSLESIAGHEIEARLVGPGASPGWLTEAWARAEAQGIEQVRLTKSFRKFYGIKKDEELLVDVTPVIATMQLQYDGRTFASLTGWVARDPTTRDLVVNFAPAQAGDPTSDNPPAAPEATVAPYISRRDDHQKWLEGIKGVGSYTETRGRRVYQLSIAVPTTDAAEIVSVTYQLGDGGTIMATKPGPRNDWPVTTSRKNCEGTVNIELRLASGVALPLSFDWCQDAVELPPRGEPHDASQTSTSTCNLNLVAKNPHLAQKICTEEYERATTPEEKERLLESLIRAHASYGEDGDYCQWLSEASSLGDEEAKTQLEIVRERCAAADAAAADATETSTRQRRRESPPAR
jgi:hypothetical protein